MTTLSGSLTVDEPSTRSATVGEWNVVTGAFGYTGKYITRRLLDQGQRVRTLTNHPNRENPFGERVRYASELVRHY